MPSVVFDTVIYVRSFINPFGLWGRLVFQYHDRYRLFLSLELGNEVLAVLARPEVRRKFRVTQEHVIQLAMLFEQAEVVTLGDIPPVSRDPKDDMVLTTAALAGADYLITEDEDVLVLQEYEGVKIVTAAAFLRMLEQEERAS